MGDGRDLGVPAGRLDGRGRAQGQICIQDHSHAQRGGSHQWLVSNALCHCNYSEKRYAGIVHLTSQSVGTYFDFILNDIALNIFS